MEQEVKKVYTRLKKIFNSVDKAKLNMYDDLIKNIAFMTLTLNELQEQIQDKGVIEKFEQGKQNFLRESPALKSYNATIKNYTTAIKQLNDLLPEKEPKAKGEELLSFIAKGGK